MNEENNYKESIKSIKTDRIIELFMRALKGESLSVKKLADEYNVSPRSITRDINNLKAFLAENSDMTGYAELVYSSINHCYTLKMDNLLSNSELLAITKILIGCRAFNSEDLMNILSKLKKNTTYSDRAKLDSLLRKEIYNYQEVGSDCKSVIDNVWKLSDCINSKNTITVTYYKMNRCQVVHKIKPVSIMFTEYYFYLIAYKCESDNPDMPTYFRIDRITDITVHREKYVLSPNQNIDEGVLRNKSHFMFPGPNRKIKFEFTGPSVQSILDKIPTARKIERIDNKYIIEAEVFGDGIKMFLLSQGSWVKVIAPADFVQEMKDEIAKMQSLY